MRWILGWSLFCSKKQGIPWQQEAESKTGTLCDWELRFLCSGSLNGVDRCGSTMSTAAVWCSVEDVPFQVRSHAPSILVSNILNGLAFHTHGGQNSLSTLVIILGDETSYNERPNTAEF